MAEPTRRIETFLGFPKLLPLFPPPEKGTYPYFAGGDRFRFEPTTRQHSPTNAWWLAEFSLLAYADPAEILDLIQQSGLIAQESFFWLESDPTFSECNTQGFVLETHDYAIVSFRGTEFPPPSAVARQPRKLLNIIADIRTDIGKLSPQVIGEGTPTFDTPVHPGFAKALQSIWDPLQEALRHLGGKPLWLTGHSMGGALATLLAYQVPDQVAGLYTFGSPCVGTTSFIQACLAKGLTDKAFRYVHGNDAIAKALELWRSAGYQHLGKLCSLDAGQRRGILAAFFSRALGSVGGLDLIDHVPIFYTYETWNDIP